MNNNKEDIINSKKLIFSPIINKNRTINRYIIKGIKEIIFKIFISLNFLPYYYIAVILKNNLYLL